MLVLTFALITGFAFAQRDKFKLPMVVEKPVLEWNGFKEDKGSNGKPYMNLTFGI